MPRRVLASLWPRKIQKLTDQLARWVREHNWSGGPVGQLLDAVTSDPKERIQYRATLTVVDRIKSGEFKLGDIRQVLVWGEGYDDPNIQLEYKLKATSEVAQAALRAGQNGQQGRSQHR